MSSYQISKILISIPAGDTGCRRTVVWDEEKWETLKLLVADAPEQEGLRGEVLAGLVNGLVQDGLSEDTSAGLVRAALDAVYVSA
ncbi:MAG: hypothetical protein A3D67_01260 [Candidatus Lloydbacteria bacterium RIFCSPHIGHO2_02_FULL_51_22]|uniref:Uncharacterized protein n=2 Tax=Candidatus Lloydiibacteriota TaxID=1817910 RepID=A0A1G2D6J5_9BACT|nr:MAG: hypothetical protein A3D67_01260 [Candidatus Lloydbacteria bacterium RIFCSPHIGHO2_02_FULL_51_22]OGZ15848.1 MAG: hypothetical protein A3J08_03505 [Candidatus Lloydbacteria bacterium RIFCSPLOWO2_02_FULL_51_11]